MTAPQRKSVPLTPDALRALERIRDVDTAEAKAAAALAGTDLSHASEGQALAAVIDIGRRLIDERVREDSYRQLAQFDAQTRAHPERAALKARRTERERRRNA